MRNIICLFWLIPLIFIIFYQNTPETIARCIALYVLCTLLPKLSYSLYDHSRCIYIYSDSYWIPLSSQNHNFVLPCFIMSINGIIFLYCISICTIYSIFHPILSIDYSLIGIFRHTRKVYISICKCIPHMYLQTLL